MGGEGMISIVYYANGIKLHKNLQIQNSKQQIQVRMRKDSIVHCKFLFLPGCRLLFY